MIKKRFLFLIPFLFLSFGLKLSAEAEAEAEAQEDSSANWGFIFNTSSILLDLDSYQAGLGTKVLFPNDLALRFLIDGYYSSSVNLFDASLGLALEKHVRPGRVSPYWGGAVKAGIMSKYLEVNPDDWTRDISIPFSAAAILGVEFFVFESVSLFAEYNLIFEASILKRTSSVGGEITSNPAEFSFSVDTGIGNEAMLGIVIYLDNVVVIDRK